MPVLFRLKPEWQKVTLRTALGIAAGQIPVRDRREGNASVAIYESGLEIRFTSRVDQGYSEETPWCEIQPPLIEVRLVVATSQEKGAGNPKTTKSG